MTELLLQVSDLRVTFGARTAVCGASFEVRAGETVGLVGESGSGKSSIARAILRLLPAHSGRVVFRGENLLTCTPAEMRRRRKELQIVFQDPLASLDPRRSVGETIAEPLEIFEAQLGAREIRLRVGAMLERVGLGADMQGRYPHEFSGGQCQRIGIARAMIVNPALLVCDEPVSSLDVSIQGQIINLLADMQRDTGMAILFISHDLAIVRHLSHRVLVLFQGELVETAATDVLFGSPAHPYSRALLAAVAGTATDTAAIEETGAAAAAATRDAGQRGCIFRHRCMHAIPLCESVAPSLMPLSAHHRAACHRAQELTALRFVP